MSAEYTSGALEAACGCAAATYAANEHRGGRSNAKGRDFELMYGAVRVAELAAGQVATGGKGDDIQLADQLLCFVDDLVVFETRGRTMSQVKSGAVSWNGGDRSLSDDFRMQRKVDESLGVKATYELVVSDRARMEGLRSQRPDDIAEVSVTYQSAGKLEAVFAEHPGLVDSLDIISVRPPRTSTREQTFQRLLAAWATSRGTVTLQDVINSASTGPDALIGPLGESYEVPIALAEALNAIPGFSFEVRRNHLAFRCDGISGYAAHHCLSEEFRAMAEAIIETKPTAFANVHAILRGQL